MESHGCASIDALVVGSAPPRAERHSPASGNSNRRQLAGKTIGNGRYLLLERTESDRPGLHFLARDLFGGLEVVVTLGPEADASAGPRVKGVQLLERGPSLPPLCSAEEFDGGNPASEHERGGASLLHRLWRRLLLSVSVQPATRLRDHS